jgi:hypothetical protein
MDAELEVNGTRIGLHDDESRRQMRRINFLGDSGGSVVAGDVS